MKLIALHPIKHNGKRYAPGDVLSVDQKAQAQALIDCGAAEPSEKAKAEPKKDGNADGKTEDA